MVTPADPLPREADAMQEQEIARAVLWLKSHHPASMMAFFDEINAGDPHRLRKLSDAHLKAVMSLAVIAFYEVSHRAAQGELQ